MATWTTAHRKRLTVSILQKNARTNVDAQQDWLTGDTAGDKNRAWSHDAWVNGSVGWSFSQNDLGADFDFVKSHSAARKAYRQTNWCLCMSVDPFCMHTVMISRIEHQMITPCELEQATRLLVRLNNPKL